MAAAVALSILFYMRTNMETVLSDLQNLIDDLEKLLVASTGEAKEHAEQAVSNWRHALKGSQERLEKLQEDTRERVAEAVRTASQTLRDNPWKSVSIVAATGFLLGLALSRHDHTQR